MSSRQPESAELALLKLYQYIRTNKPTIAGLFAVESLQPEIEVIVKPINIEATILSKNTGLSPATITTLIHKIQEFSYLIERKHKLETTGKPIEEVHASSSAASSETPQQRLTSEIAQLEQQLVKLTDARETDLKPVLTAISAYNCYNRSGDEIKKLTRLMKERDEKRRTLEQVFQNLDNALLFYHEDKRSDKPEYLDAIAVKLGKASIKFKDVEPAIIDYIDNNIPEELKEGFKNLLNCTGNEEEFTSARGEFQKNTKAIHLNKFFDVPLKNAGQRLQSAHDYHNATQQSHRHIAQIVASWYANKLYDLLVPLLKNASHLTDEQKSTYQKQLECSCRIAHPNSLFASLIDEFSPTQVKADSRKKPSVKKGRRSKRSSSAKSHSKASSSSPATIIDFPKAQGLNDPLHFIKMYRLAQQWLESSDTYLIPVDSDLMQQLGPFRHNLLSISHYPPCDPSRWQNEELTDTFITEQKQRDRINEQLTQKKQQLQRVKEEFHKQQQEKFERQLAKVNQDYDKLHKEKAVLGRVSKSKLESIILGSIQSGSTWKLKILMLIHGFKLSSLAAKTNNYFQGTNSQLVTIILDNIPIDELTEQHSNLLIELFREGFIAKNHITKFDDFYRNLLLDLINAGDSESVKLLYKFVKPNLQNNIIDDETGDTILHLAIKLKNLDLLTFSLEQGCNYRQLNSQGESPLSGLANLACSEHEYAALIAQLPRNVFTCTDVTNRSLYQLATGTNEQIIFDHIIATSINLITAASKTEADEIKADETKALVLLQTNQLNLGNISLATIKAMTSKSLLERYRLLRFQNQQGGTIYTLTKPNEALKEFIIETIVECLYQNPSLTKQAQILMLANHLSSDDLIAYFKNHPALIEMLESDDDNNNEAKSLKAFISQIQKENLQKCPTLASMKQLIIEYVAKAEAEVEHEQINERILGVLQHHFKEFFEPANLLDDVELVDTKTVQGLYRWLNLAFDIKHGFIPVDETTQLASLHRYQPANFLYQTYENYFTGDFDPGALFKHINNNEIEQQLTDLLATSNRIRNKFRQDSQLIKHAAINFALLAKHYESERTQEVFNNPMYRVINHRRAKNLIHRLFIWLTNWFKHDTTSQKSVTSLSQIYHRRGYCSTLFKPEDCSVLYRLTNEDALQSSHRGCYILIENKGLCYYPQQGEVKLIQSIEQLQQSDSINLKRFLLTKLSHGNPVNIPSNEMKQQLLSYTYYREGISTNNMLASPVTA